MNREAFGGALLMLVLCSIMSAQNCVVTNYKEFAPATGKKPIVPPLVAIAFGTSLMWGDGLRAEHTFRYSVAQWLTDTVGRSVNLWTFAHSAAYLMPIDGQGSPSPDPSDGALNGNYPSVDQQADCAAGEQYRLSHADLIMLDGCINDVNAIDIVAPWTSAKEILQKTKEYCGSSMASVLKQIRFKFPAATIVVVGYYPIVSTKSSVFGFWGTRIVSNYANKAADARTSKTQKRPAKNISKADETNGINENSDVFYQTAKSEIVNAIKDVNVGGPEKIFYAGLPEIQVGSKQTVDPNFAYGAPQTHEWLVPFRFLFWIFNPDEEYKTRRVSCKSNYSPGIDRDICEINPSFHPNVNGAIAYTESIKSVIPISALAAWNP